MRPSSRNPTSCPVASTEPCSASVQVQGAAGGGGVCSAPGPGCTGRNQHRQNGEGAGLFGVRLGKQFGVIEAAGLGRDWVVIGSVQGAMRDGRVGDLSPAAR